MVTCQGRRCACGTAIADYNRSGRCTRCHRPGKTAQYVPPKPLAAGRCCDWPRCRTILSMYNPHGQCGLHRPAQVLKERQAVAFTGKVHK